MSIEELLLSYRQKGVELSLNGDKLKFSAPKGTLTEDDKAVLKENKARIIEYLSNTATMMLSLIRSISTMNFR